MKKLLYLFLFIPFTFLGQGNSYEEHNIPLFIPEGWSMFGFTCQEPQELNTAFDAIQNNVIIVKDYLGAAYLPEFGFDGIGTLNYSWGYQIKTTEEITDFQFCPTIVSGNNSGPVNGYEIGDIAQGGIIFHLDETGEHGLVAAMEDVSGGYEWGCYMENVGGADYEWIGTGYQNTMDIVNQGCSTEDGGPTAAQAALAYESGVYSDWYLPSKDELVEMYNTIGQGSTEGNIGGFVNSSYYSSTESNNESAWYFDFDVGLSFYFYKNYNKLVRPIRSF